jgi:serine phosphatase RsbU (regulator of sigma subunit)
MRKEKTNVSAAEENKAIFRRYAEEVGNQQNFELVDEIFERYISHQPDGSTLVRGPEDVKRFHREFHSAFSNFHINIEEQIAEGDKVVSRYTMRGTHQRAFRGMAPTGKEVELKAVTIFRFSPEGKVVETWDSYDQLSLMRHSVEQELQVARSIQQASLPKEVPQLEGWQISPFYRPAREVGGDFYDFFELQEGRVGVVVGDATGKGMPAALVAGAASNMLRAVAQALGSSSSPGEVLAQVNETLLARIPANMFVTCFYAIVEDESGRLLYANAGHNLPCCRRDDGHAAATTTTTDLSARGMPLGIMPQMNYEEKESVLVPGEGVLFYTDGLVEAHNSQGEMFGTPRLRSLLSERPEAGRGLSATLMEELERFTGKGWEQEDDITLLTLERSANRS